MSYAMLADEIIVQIVKLVRSKDIESFALVDPRTYRIAHDRLMKRRALKRNAKVMSARFGPPFRSLGLCAIGSSHIFSQRPELAERYDIPLDGAAADLDYLELNGDLQWLQPLDDETAKSHVWDQGCAASEKRLLALVESAKGVGVEFPKAFLKMLGSNEFIQRMYMGGDFFDLGPSLVKCNPEDDQEGGGYAIRFLSDQQGCGYWALYVAPGGYHCVLDAPDDVHCWKCLDEGPYGRENLHFEDHQKYKTHKGIPVACDKLDISLAHPDFESWLAMKYFDGWCSATLYDGRELTETQTEYLDHFWPKKNKV